MKPMEEPELVDIDLDGKGEILVPKHDKRIIIDADTVVFASCTVCEFELNDMESGEIIYDIDLENAFTHSKEKLEFILDSIGGKVENTELHFTGGKESFRYKLLEEAFPGQEHRQYKFKRQKKHTPAGLDELKAKMLEHYDGKIHYDFEADDIVTYLKKQHGDDSIMCAVDKDVWRNTPGIHWNYYSSLKYNIDMKWVEISEDEAVYYQYLQAIIGDKSDNVPGLHGIGEAKAAKFIEIGMNESELWEGVVTAYVRHCDYGDPYDMALLNMRLVNMHQLQDNMEIKLWEPSN